jgi:hypothetical protein
LPLLDKGQFTQLHRGICPVIREMRKPSMHLAAGLLIKGQPDTPG